MNKRRKQKTQGKVKVAPLESLQPVNMHVAGLDIGASEIYAAVAPGDNDESVRVFPTFTVDLYALAEWLANCGVTSVAMESTGVYWIPVYEILESKGFTVHLVNARHVHQTGSPKTDVLDCQRIQQLHSYGLLRGSFHPSEDVRAIRALVRHRENLLQSRATHIQHMQKALHLMNVQLTNVLSDITGVTGMNIIRAILAGRHDPHDLAQFRDPRCAKSEEEIAKSLQGNYRREHLFALRQAVELYDFYTAQMTACDREIEQLYAVMQAHVDPEQMPLPPAKRSGATSKNSPDYDLRTALYRVAGVDLTAIDGLNVLSVQTILSEIGVDMSKWPTSKHFCTWLGLAPNNEISGGKRLRTDTKPVKSRANLAFRQAAQSLANSKSALGSYYRRMRARFGPPVANVATAHKLARIVYAMLTTKEPYYDAGADAYEAREQANQLRNLERKARKFGFLLVPSSTTFVAECEAAAM
jgi:transposase